MFNYSNIFVKLYLTYYLSKVFILSSADKLTFYIYFLSLFFWGGLGSNGGAIKTFLGLSLSSMVGNLSFLF